MLTDLGKGKSDVGLKVYLPPPSVNGTCFWLYVGAEDLNPINGVIAGACLLPIGGGGGADIEGGCGLLLAIDGPPGGGGGGGGGGELAPPLPNVLPGVIEAGGGGSGDLGGVATGELCC